MECNGSKIIRPVYDLAQPASHLQLVLLQSELQNCLFLSGGASLNTLAHAIVETVQFEDFLHRGFFRQFQVAAVNTSSARRFLARNRSTVKVRSRRQVVITVLELLQLLS